MGPRLMGSRTNVVSESMRNALAASIQMPRQPRDRSVGYTDFVYSPPWHVRRTSNWANVSVFRASRSTVDPSPTSGPGPPGLDVEKNDTSKSSKSPSACIRSINTEPTMPLQPINPVRICSPNEKRPNLQRIQNILTMRFGLHLSKHLFNLTVLVDDVRNPENAIEFATHKLLWTPRTVGLHGRASFIG